MKINLLALAFCFCILVFAALVQGVLAQGDGQFTISPFADYDLLSQRAIQEQPPGFEVVSDQQVSDQQPPYRPALEFGKEQAAIWQTATGQTATGQTTSGPGGASSEGVNGIFLYLEGVPGESTDKSHKDWIDVISFDYGIRSPPQYGASAGGAAAGRPQFGDLVITKYLDRASPQLYLLASNGMHIPEARLEVIRRGNLVLRYRLSDVTVGAVETAGEAADRILDKVSLKYGKIEWTYFMQGPTGQPSGEVKTGWDLAANRAV
jgi:type VI secretion system secreted protein Hcp